MWPREGIRYPAPYWILQDHRLGFSLGGVRGFGFAINSAAMIIGSRSYGAGCGYSNGGTSLKLPALGLLVRAPDCQRLRMDGTNEAAGIAPDVNVEWSEGDSGADSVRKAIVAVESVVCPGNPLRTNHHCPLPAGPPRPR